MSKRKKKKSTHQPRQHNSNERSAMPGEGELELVPPFGDGHWWTPASQIDRATRGRSRKLKPLSKRQKDSMGIGILYVAVAVFVIFAVIYALSNII